MSTPGIGDPKEIIDTYNANRSKSSSATARGYAVKYTDDWCDIFVSFVGLKAGASALIDIECGVERHVEIFKNKGIWQEDGRITPRAGDIIVYDWNDGTQPNDGWADHIGYVEKVVGSQIVAIEGNKGEVVARRYIPVGWGYIRGFARPKYTSNVQPTPVKPVTSKIAEDGQWGNGTTKKLQLVLGTTADGVISNQWRDSSTQYIWSAQFNKTQKGSDVVRAIQRKLGVRADGLLGYNTIKAMQKHYGTHQDGIVSPVSDMVKAMQRALNSNRF